MIMILILLLLIILLLTILIMLLGLPEDGSDEIVSLADVLKMPRSAL